MEKHDRYNIQRDARDAAETVALEKLNISETSSSCAAYEDDNSTK